MAVADPPLEIRPTALARGYVIAFGVVWFAGLLAIGVGAVLDGEPVVAVIIPVMLVFGLVIILVNVRPRVLAEGEELVVRNRFGTRRLRRTDVESFRAGELGPGLPFGGTVHALLTDGTMLALHATERLGGADDAAARLRSWLAPSG